MAYSIQRAVSDGTLSTIALDIEFFSQTHIFVYVDELVIPNSTYTFKWIGSKTIQITPAVPRGVEVVIRRRTPYAAPLHNFRLGAVFKDETIDENFTQTMYITQESLEGQTSTDYYANLNFHGYKLRNVGEALNANDAVPLGQYQADANGAYQSRLAAEAARADAYAARTQSASSAAAAASSEVNALSYKNSAGTSATNAAASEANALASKNAAATSAANAANSATAAANSAANAAAAEAVIYAGTIAVVMAIALG